MDINNLRYTNKEINLLQKWSEMAHKYHLLHNKAYLEYQSKNYIITIPVIVLSTLSGTASFTIQSFPDNIKNYVPMIIGGINIFVGILQTMSQFLQINELIGFHRNASINYEKFSRNIIAELALPSEKRTHSGKDFILICKNDIDNIIKQSPNIPSHILKNIELITKNDKINEYKAEWYKNHTILNNTDIENNISTNITIENSF